MFSFGLETNILKRGDFNIRLKTSLLLEQILNDHTPSKGTEKDFEKVQEIQDSPNEMDIIGD